MSFRIAVAGATGNIGREMLSILAEHEIPVGDVVALASTASKGVKVSYGEDDLLAVQNLEQFDFSGTSVVLFATDAKTAARQAPRAAAAGCVAIDITSQFHMEPGVPLVVPEVNPDALARYEKKLIVASPRAASIHLALCLKPLHDAAYVRRVVVSTYQSTALAGQAGMDELFRQTRGVYVNESPADTQEAFPKQIAFNVIPQVNAFQKDGSTHEEWAIAVELRKLIDPDLKVHANCAIVPSFIGNGYYVTLETESPLSEHEVREILKNAPGVSVVDHRAEEGYVTPAEVPGEDPIFVSRVRKDETVENGLSFWVAADALRKGTALNAVQIAEMLRDSYL